MMVIHLGDHGTCLEGIMPVQGDTVIVLSPQALQAIHVIDDKNRSLLVRLLPGEVPGGPGVSLLRQYRGVCMQDRMVQLVLPGREELLLPLARVEKQCQSLVGMRCNNDLVKIHRRPVTKHQPDLLWQAFDTTHRRVQMKLTTETIDELFDISKAATDDGAPLRPVA